MLIQAIAMMFYGDLKTIFG